MADGPLPLRRLFGVAVEVFRDDDVGRQLRPIGRDLAIGLLEQRVAVLVFDRRRPQFPLGGVERRFAVVGAKDGVDLQTGVAATQAGAEPLAGVLDAVLAVDFGEGRIILGPCLAVP